MNKILSVAVPSYNVEKYLADTLASYVAGEVDERLEVLIVDDGSTDATPAIAAEFVRLWPSIFRVVSKRNGGHGSAVNAGIDAATGKYYRVIDGDDRMCTLNIPALLDALEESDADVFVDVKREVNIETGESRLLTLPPDLPRGVSLSFDEVCCRDDIEEFFKIHTMSMRTDFLREAGVRLLEHTFYVDYEWAVKIGAAARTIAFCDLEGCNYYVGNAEQSVAPANYVRRWGDHTRVTNELLRFADIARWSGSLEPARQEFVDMRVRLLVDTHYNIALIYDDDRVRGLERADMFRAFMKQEHPLFYAWGEKRYRQANVLHRLGFDARKLDRLMGRA